ncbi:MAG TPA: VWA domain-containing protein [Pyrinomonadaceae bacterium]|jgi:Ca-activated chloride channel family protein|nr:VWA domain-containing protein [Pyrinomonadaceae bacterium]
MQSININKIAAVFSLLFALTFSLSAQTPAPTATPKIQEDTEVLKVDSRLVVVPVSVTDAAGQPVQGLTAKDFRIAEEGKEQTIDHVGDAAKVPLEIVLLFDVSASTDAMFKFEQDTAAKFLSEVMRPDDRATIYTVGANPVLVQPRDTAEKSIAAIKAIQPTKEFTAFYDSVGEAAEYLRKNAPSGTRRVVVVISDGEDTNSTRIAQAIQNGYKRLGDKLDTMDEKTRLQYTVNSRNEASVRERIRVLHALQNADSVFYSINPGGSSLQLNKISQFGQENMQKFADDTGGSAFLPKFLPIDTKDTLANSSNMKRNSALLEQIFSQLANELRAQYLVQYYSEANFPLNRYVKLDVNLQNPTGRKIRARQGYYVKN